MASKRNIDTKLSKKLNKHTQKLFRKEKITASNSPTSILCVCNGGLDNGVSQEEIFNLFSGHSETCEVIMLPQKSYCFVCFSSQKEAETSCINLNGYTLPITEDRKTEVILYVIYVSEAPCSVSPSIEKPPGLLLLEDFVTVEYAEKILSSIKWDDCIESAQSKELKHRKVKHYGYEFKYTINNVEPDEPLVEGVPDVYRPMLDRLLDLGHIQHYPDQLTINQYQPGQGIPPHIDTPSAFEDGLVALSLGSQVLMEFRHQDGQHLSVLLPERSVLIMTGESRYIWSHGITPRKSDIVPSPSGGLTLSQRGVRTSFTFRKITGVKPEQQSEAPSLPNTEETAADLELMHVHQVYEEIADHFSGTRHTPWPRIVEFLQKWPPGSLLADFGCGNGKYFGINRHMYEIGSDRSFNLAKICHERKFQVFVGDVLSIPLRCDKFDVCLCIAVIHHLSTKERRIKALSELMKILRPGGQALVYVWALEQEVNKVKSKYLKKKDPLETQSDHICSDNNGANALSLNEDSHSKESAITKEYVTDKDCTTDMNYLKDSEHVNNKCKPSGGETNDESVNISSQNTEPDLSSGDNSLNIGQSPTKLEVHVNRTKFKQQDVLVPWQLKSKENQSKSGNTFHRYYHVFQQGEIEKLCESVENCKVVMSYYDQGNWAVVIEKC